MDWLAKLFEHHAETLTAQLMSDGEKVGFLFANSFEFSPTGMSSETRLQKIRNRYHELFIEGEGA